jgi:hypothetical protein
MTAGIYVLTLDQGANFNLELLYKDANNAVINLNGYTAAMQIRKAYDASVKALDLTTENGGIVITGNLGKIAISATATQTAAIPSGEYVYDVEITSGGVVSRILQGNVNVSPEVTRA